MAAKNKNYGFTLLEVLVVIAIFALIMASVFANFRQGEFSNQLSLAADNVATEIRKVQTMVASGVPTYVCMAGAVITGVCEDDPAACGGDCIEHVPFGGYGLAFEEGSDTMALFADLDESGSFDDPEELIRNLPISVTGRVIVERMNTETGALDTLEVIFSPPKSMMSFFGPGIFGDPSEATITLGHEVSGRTEDITLNNISSRIDVIR